MAGAFQVQRTDGVLSCEVSHVGQAVAAYLHRALRGSRASYRVLFVDEPVASALVQVDGLEDVVFSEPVKGGR